MGDSGDYARPSPAVVSFTRALDFYMPQPKVKTKIKHAVKL
jgi:hypothetical protein